MKLTMLALVGTLACGLTWGQRYKLTINAETPEGGQLQAIGQESDAGKKLALMEKFVNDFPKHEGAAWVYSQMIPAYVAAGDMPKASRSGDALLAMHPDDLEAAVAILKGYEKVKDPAAVIKWSATTSSLAAKLKALPKPSDAEEEKTWKENQQYADQVQQYSEYALMSQAAQAGDPPKALDCLNALEKMNPNSPYYMQAANATFLALRQAGQMDQAVELADKVLLKDPNNEEMLVVAANHYYTKQNMDKAVAYSAKLIEVTSAKPKPAQVSDEDWNKRKTTLLTAGNWILGMGYAGQNKLQQADKVLRDVLPSLTDDSMKGGALFQLGVVNVKMGEALSDVKRMREKIGDGYNFSQQAAAIKSPYQAMAAKNVASLKAKYKITGPVK